MQKPVAGPVATGCANLQTLGHLKNGFYFVKSQDPSMNKLVSVYCDFTQQPEAKGQSVFSHHPTPNLYINC